MLSNEERLERTRLGVASQIPNLASSLETNGYENQLAFVVPTEHVVLPSKGLFYSEDHPLYRKDTIEIKQLTTKEEDILTNRSLIKKGIVIDKLLESLIVNRNIDTQSLLIGDRNAILLAARRTGYGDDYGITANCTNCGAKNSVNLNLTTFLEESEVKLEKKLENIDSNNASVLENGNIVIKLPKTNWIVECKLLNGRDELYLLNLSEAKKKSSINEDITIAEQLSIMIVAIQMVTDKQRIIEAIRNMPAADSKFLRKTYQECSPSFDMKTEVECKSCGNQSEVEVGFNQEFFWPNR